MASFSISTDLSAPPPPYHTCFFSTSSGSRLLRSSTSRLTLRRLDTKMAVGLQAESLSPPTPPPLPRNNSSSASSAPSLSLESFSGHSDTFLNVASEADLLLRVQQEVESKRIPARAGHGMVELYRNYKAAVSEGDTSQESIVQIMSTVLDRVLLQFEEPFTFPAYHKAMREPYDYYAFGQNYIRPLLNFRNSYLGNLSRFDEIEERLKQGHNVVLLANHQTEADPAVMALLLESSHPYISENLTYIAGDRVVADPFCKPFSMGRNLVCVYSKKHINDEPELVDMKRKANARALKELALLLRYITDSLSCSLNTFKRQYRSILCVIQPALSFNGGHMTCVVPYGLNKDHLGTYIQEGPVMAQSFPHSVSFRKGGQLIWIAPSGGRDRPDSATMKWKPALFDTASVENMRRLVEHSKAPGHLYPLALLCYGVMPPPVKVEKEIGERRVLGFTGVGMSVGAELHYKDMTAGCESTEEAAERFSQLTWERVNEHYGVLSRAIDEREGVAASTDTTILSQPWIV